MGDQVPPPPPRADRASLFRAVNELREIFVSYDRVMDAHADIATLHRRDNGSSEGGVMTLFGDARSGKTKLLRDYAKRFPHVPRGRSFDDGSFADLMEVVVLRVPDGNTKNFLEKLLATLINVPVDQLRGADARRFDVHQNVIAMARKVGLRLLLLEEAHQSTERKKIDVARDMAGVLKDLTNEGVFSIVISGTFKARRLLEASDELSGRVLYQHELTPLSWDRPDERRMFTEVMASLDEHLRDSVFGRLSGLAAEAMAKPLLLAGRGQIGHAAGLIEVGSLAAVDDMLAGRADRLTADHIARAVARSPLRAPDADAEQPSPGDNFMTKARGRTRRSNRDADFKG